MIALDWKLYKVGHCLQFERLTCVTAPWSFCNFPSLVALITHPDKGRILFDTGYAPQFFEETRRFPERLHRYATPVTIGPHEHLREQLARDRIQPGDISTVVLSHLHADHIAGVADFPGARLLCAREGWAVLQRLGRFAGVRRGLIRGLLPADFGARSVFFEDLKVASLPHDVLPFERGYDLFGDGSMFVVPLPGHAVGQFGLIFQGTDHQTGFPHCGCCVVHRGGAPLRDADARDGDVGASHAGVWWHAPDFAFSTCPQSRCSDRSVALSRASS